MGRDRGPVVVPPPVRGLEPLPIIPTANVKLHIEGERFWVDRDGPHAIQVAQVVGLTGNPAVRLYRAMLAPGIPRYGEYHPAVPFLPVSNVEAVYADKGTSDIAIVTITFGFAAGGTQYFTNEPGDTLATLPQLEVLTTVQPARTEFEFDPASGGRKQIIVSNFVEDPETGTSMEVTQTGSVEFMLPMETVRYMRRELYNPQSKSRLYLGHINSHSVFGDPPHWWLCSHLGGPTDDGGASYNVTYEFQRNSDSWNPVLVPTNPETGKPHILVEGEIARQPRILPEADFWELNLTLPG